MADVQSPGYKNAQQNGEYGNARVAIMSVALAAFATTDLALLGQLPGSCRIHRVTAKTGDMGAAQTMDIGYRYKVTAEGTSDPDGFFDGIDTGTAAATNTYVGPVTIAAGQGVDIVAAPIGAAATGQLDVIIEYEYLGQ
jgi:hypothetical protein